MPRGLNSERIGPDAPDPRFPAEAQFDLVVEGSSLDKLAREGELLRCVDIGNTSVSSGDIVVIERLRGDSLELLGKRALLQGEDLELWSESTLDYWREPVIRQAKTACSASGVRVIGKVLYTHRRR